MMHISVSLQDENFGRVCLCGWIVLLHFFEIFLGLNYFFVFFLSFWYVDIKKKKNYFDVFPSEKYFEKQFLTHLKHVLSFHHKVATYSSHVWPTLWFIKTSTSLPTFFHFLIIFQFTIIKEIQFVTITNIGGSFKVASSSAFGPIEHVIGWSLVLQCYQ